MFCGLFLVSFQYYHLNISTNDPLSGLIKSPNDLYYNDPRKSPQNLLQNNV